MNCPIPSASKFQYIIYGVTVVSDFDLPELMPNQDKTTQSDTIFIKRKKTPKTLTNDATFSGKRGIVNEEEFLMKIRGGFKIYVHKGKEIWIESSKDFDYDMRILLYINGFTAIFLQRNRFILHVSGVISEDNNVVLFAAPSGIGKSTTAIKLMEYNYRFFTDDTALLCIEHDKCYVYAGIPSVRLWENSIKHQSVLSLEKSKRILSKNDKFSFDNLENYFCDKMAVSAIVFLEANGNEIIIENLDAMSCFRELIQNVFAESWIKKMKKSTKRFQQISMLANCVKSFRATRPLHIPSYNDFSSTINTKILKVL